MRNASAALHTELPALSVPALHRLYLMHNLFRRVANGKLILAPYVANTGDQILDVGTAAGMLF